MDQIDNELISIIDSKKQTTAEIEAALKAINIGCPEILIRRLNLLRKKGIIQGEVSKSVGCWVWWRLE
jgi:hypothetical protein